MAQIIDGKKIAKEIKDEVAQQVSELKNQGLQPTLAVILVGDNAASQVYVNNKKKACIETGIQSISHELPAQTTETELLTLIGELNDDPAVHGILVQLPLPKQMDEKKILLAIDPSKDVDGFHPFNVGLLQTGYGRLKPCTPAGIIELLKRTHIDLTGKHCVIVGRSNIVGKPVATLLLEANATVTIVHSKTVDLPSITRQGDVVVVAVGKVHFITANMVKDGAVVIDVGTNRVDGKLYGDVDFDHVQEKASWITPVPGGVGPMTIAMLMQNCVIACKTIAASKL